MTDQQVRLTREYCGAVAVSWYRSRYTQEAIKRFVDAGCRTNIHYVLSKNFIAEAVERLSGKGFADSINAVIFLMHKPVGQGERKNMITKDEPTLKEFCTLVNEQNVPYKIGFDSCSVPMIVNYCPNIAKITLDTCEGGRYSCYISSEMVTSPCSFDREEKYGVSLKTSLSARFGTVRSLKPSATVCGSPARNVPTRQFAWAAVRSCPM